MAVAPIKEGGWVDVPGGKVWFLRVGRRTERPPLLVLHGGPGAPHDFLLPLRDLADERQVIFYDQLGCGNSERPEDNGLWTVDRFVEELHLVRTGLGLEEMHVMGCSWGTMLLTSYLEEHGQDGIVSTVMSGPAISTKIFLDGARGHISSLPEEMRDRIWKAESSGTFDDPGYQEAMMEYYRRHVCRVDPWPEIVNRTFEKMGQAVYRTMWGPSEFTCTGTLKDFDNRNVLRGLDVPVLYTCGEFDEAAPCGVRKYLDITPNAEMVIFPKASHMHHLERPSEFSRAVRGFFHRVE
ncbi:MAG: Proline iminopeptidase [Methanomassiliicoccales archaeon PtaU1.Bin124]|nr:MAG: Proline iminopeptidase [Methanomassiliicoccales archaeon PtaU1.Bin124]